MGIFKRLQDIVSANLSDMIDEWEEPETMLRQAVREMEVAIAEARREVARAMANEKLVLRDLEDRRRQMRDWQERAEKAVRAGDDALARRALARRQDCEKLGAALEEQAHTAGETTTLLRQQLEAMQAKLLEAQRRLGTIAARLKAAEVRARVHAAPDLCLSQAPFEEFDRLRSKVERMEAEAEALRDLERSLPGARAAVADPGAVEIESEVDAELEALKRKLRGV